MLIDLVKNYDALFLAKAELTAKLDEVKAELADAKEQVIQAMLDEDTQSISTGGYRFTLVCKTKYSKCGDGQNFIGTLRAEGLGDLVIETVNASTLSSAMNEYVEEHGKLSPALAKVISTYEMNDISRKKC